MKIGKKFGDICCLERQRWAKEQCSILKPTEEDSMIANETYCSFCGKMR